MSMESLEFDGDSVKVSGRSITTKHQIDAAFMVGSHIVVLYDPDLIADGASNLVCVDLDGRELWKAEFPRMDRNDYYYRIASTDPLVAYSFTSFECEISLKSGKILSKAFFK